MSRAFSPYTPPPLGPHGGRQTLYARLIWTTQMQLWRYTNGGTITGPGPDEPEAMTLPSPEPVSITVSAEPVTEPEP